MVAKTGTFLPGQAPGVREQVLEREGWSGTFSVITNVDFTAQTVKRRTVTVHRGKIIHVGEEV